MGQYAINVIDRQNVIQSLYDFPVLDLRQ